MLVVENFLRRIDAHQRTEFIHVAICADGPYLHLFSVGELCGQQSRQTADLINLIALASQRLGVFFRKELQRQNTHSY